MSADNKDDFDKKVKDFTSVDHGKFGKPVVFEVFTTIPDEQEGVNAIQATNRPAVLQQPEPTQDDGTYFKTGAKSSLKRVAPDSFKKVYRKLRGRE
jgi:hypothetical protein